ncbi:MAG: hypothetical protein CMB11_09580 [Euryarchaeota archaeon]|nr:hypothetical protein [Euryarchaeota archaeon]|tara:strand:- start:278 stop:880 length:603 start_codon:yes stop_codon:yes gene_type:complete
MSEQNPRRRVHDERAEVAISSLLFLSVVLVTTSILSTFLLSITERTMVDGRETANSQSDVLNGIVSVTYIELSGLNGAAGDELHIGFEFPYLVGNLEDSAVRWVLLCSDGDTGNAEEVTYTAGDFEPATSMIDDGRTDATLDRFDSSGIYHMYMVINAGTGDCDLDANFDGQLVLAIEKGRTFETRIQLGTNPSVGDQFL